MYPILTPAQMRACETDAIQDLGIPSILLMENAGHGTTQHIDSFFPDYNKERILILCGNGNNGGDGAVIARWLNILGHGVHIVLVNDKKQSRDLKKNLDICSQMGVPISSLPPEEEDLQKLILSSTLIVDAIYGTGFRGDLPPEIVRLVQMVNETLIPICSVDIPSGLCAVSGDTQLAFNASLTVAMEAYKPGHFLGKGKIICGELRLAPIGIPRNFARQYSDLTLFEEADYWLPERNPTAHKGSFGRLVIIGGNTGFTGASLLATGAALRSGIGYVYLYHRPEHTALYASRLTEALHQPVPETAKGLPDAAQLDKLWANADAILIGPGLGKDAWALEMLKLVLKRKDIPLILDADALNLIAENKKLLPHLMRPDIVITPHWGEFCRLAEVSMEDLRSNPLEQLAAFLPQSPMTILLKSSCSLMRIMDQVAIISAGNDALATAGSGDVLSGIIASFLAQGLDTAQAVAMGALLLGKTATEQSKEREPASIIPSDIIANLMRNPKQDK
ncbi:MAG: NAD(P)H-hydrate dehydratase [Candidatus Cloacimonetes bacterium]|nr:NAD(P)H-hydrate dehydratase [Candidatus Cloacimonadota bacterium]NLO11492.1 NAD(P)H-hydrate dehydratase [Candidatus Cloacimonadota bacterium]